MVSFILRLAPGCLCGREFFFKNPQICRLYRWFYSRYFVLSKSNEKLNTMYYNDYENQYAKRAIRRINKRAKADCKKAMYLLLGMCAFLAAVAVIAKVSGL